jgi:hypothetical protein
MISVLWCLPSHLALHFCLSFRACTLLLYTVGSIFIALGLVAEESPNSPQSTRFAGHLRQIFPLYAPIESRHGMWSDHLCRSRAPNHTSPVRSPKCVVPVQALSSALPPLLERGRGICRASPVRTSLAWWTPFVGQIQSYGSIVPGYAQARGDVEHRLVCFRECR